MEWRWSWVWFPGFTIYALNAIKVALDKSICQMHTVNVSPTAIVHYYNAVQSSSLIMNGTDLYNLAIKHLDISVWNCTWLKGTTGRLSKSQDDILLVAEIKERSKTQRKDTRDCLKMGLHKTAEKFVWDLPLTWNKTQYTILPCGLNCRGEPSSAKKNMENGQTDQMKLKGNACHFG